MEAKEGGKGKDKKKGKWGRYTAQLKTMKNKNYKSTQVSRERTHSGYSGRAWGFIERHNLQDVKYHTRDTGKPMVLTCYERTTVTDSMYVQVVC